MFKENPDLYPTPKNLIDKMFSYLDFKYLSSILEPNSGKGDLVEAIQEKFKSLNRYNSNKKFDVDSIEIDPNLQAVLKSKQHRVIASDFLTFHTYKSYSAIIMNPPFSNGEKHLLHAINLIESQTRDGKIICLLNAETLRNPYSNTRKELINKLEQYDAKVEFIENAFKDAERQTNVETALIYINIPKTEYNSVLINELKKDQSAITEKQYTSDKLIHNDFIEGIVSQFNYEVKAGLKLIQEYEAMKPLMLNSFEEHNSPVLKLELNTRDDNNNLENAYIRQIRAKYWKALFSNEQFMSLFTTNLRRKIMDQIDELKDYDFSFYNIYTIRIELSKEMTQGVEDTILSLFEEFSHRHSYYGEMSKNIHLYNGWKTNKSWKINKRVIIPLNGWNWGRFEPTHYTTLEKLQDIEKVFIYLDNDNTEKIDLKEALKFAEGYGETKKIETTYFYLTFYKKQTCHIEFKNMDLLARFNRYGSQKKGWLPPSYGKVKYNNMSQSEKDVIREFEGEESYNKVMTNPSYYIVNTNEILKLTS